VSIDPLSGSIASLILGLIVGSFLNVCIYRIPKGESIVFPSSKCTRCGNSLKWYHNIPVASYLVLKGRCAFCGEPISFVYPLVEICMGLLSLALFAKYGLSWNFLFLFVFLAALVVVTFIDLQLQIIPDVISLPGIAVGFASSFLRPGLSVWDSLIGIVAGGGVLLTVFLVYYALTKREGMGIGDVKLLAMIGAFLGWRSLLFVILSSSLLGAVAGVAVMMIKRQNIKLAIPFGPFLSVGAAMYLFFGKEIITWYFGLL
jgi:leader peptidase (prepilin peptidase) / N-methyltransferase